MHRYQIDGYSLQLFSSKPTGTNQVITRILLYQENIYHGSIDFYPDGIPLKPPVDDSTNARIYLYFNVSQLHAIIDTLRNEKPLFLYYSSPTNAGLLSGKEPVGEEEY